MRYSLLLLLTAFLLTACGESAERSEAQADDAVPATRAEADHDDMVESEVMIHPVYHGSLVLMHAGKTIYVDPHGGAQRYRAYGAPDLVLITHTHGDHMDTATLNGLDLSGVLPFTGTLIENGQFGFDGISTLTALTATTGDIVSRIFLTLRDGSQSLIGETGFPTGFDLSDFSLTPIGFIGNVPGERGARERVNYTLTSLTPAEPATPVPLPAGGVLLLTAGAGLALTRWRGRA